MLPLPCLVTICYRRLNGDCAIKTGEHINPRNTDLLRLTVRFARQIHDPRHALDQKVIAGLVRTRACLTKPRDRHIDQTRIDGPKRIIIQPVFHQPTSTEIFDQDIGIRDQRFQAIQITLIPKITDNRCLSTVRGKEIRRDLFGAALWCRALNKGRSPASRVIAFRAFDLDHFGAQIGQRLTNPRPRKNPRQFDNL